MADLLTTEAERAEWTGGQKYEAIRMVRERVRLGLVDAVGLLEIETGVFVNPRQNHAPKLTDCQTCGGSGKVPA